ncbi:thioredoxin fold domain-containing protein [Mesosutterella sp. OilRF-GAM-744-9]|uniref:Thioredoxin fold domain-containing protein n=1 Tax=Mesosutterella porci TaxID=2915351 RepID=A0ABS9MRI1_9BURK|nr:thioredoxin fold domain-containing protein [Mesosutterella sp. oilRF-744-WT-GAM-9]MCG5031243.1 thioredoxin fold domain-containing protein [Mesosutterella sp. oilRF-744-WT-GAM-9]
MQRREFIAAAALAVATPAAIAAEEKKKVWPRVPLEWYGEGMFNELAEKGSGAASPGPEGRPTAYIAFDSQCPWCEKLYRASIPLNDRIKFVWCPVAVLSINSEPQGTMILAAADPWKKFVEHEEHFHDKEFRGLPVDQKEVWKLPEKIRAKVWTNSKIVRRNGTRTIPYGVFKTRAGEYRAIYSGMTTEDLKKVCDL